MQLVNRHVYLFVVTIEQREETGLGASRTLDASEAEVIACPLDVAQIPKKFLSMMVLAPLRCSGITSR